MMLDSLILRQYIRTLRNQKKAIRNKHGLG